MMAKAKLDPEYRTLRQEEQKCQHYEMYFQNGKLWCTKCDENCTPLPNVRIIVVETGYRDNIIESLKKIANEVPDDVLREIEIYAEYLQQRRKAG